MTSTDGAVISGNHLYLSFYSVLVLIHQVLFNENIFMELQKFLLYHLVDGLAHHLIHLYLQISKKD
jgi:hypothetical protein